MTGLIESIRTRDPAQPTTAEVIFAYPGFHALGFHRVAQWLWALDLNGFRPRALARFIAYLGRLFTGIEIHPGAVIGKNLFIDHGMGVVIGQTAIIGSDVTLYHGVTLGGKGGDAAGSKRHPTLEDGVIVGANAQVLGDITIGREAKIGAGALVTNNVPAGCTAVGNPARLVNCASKSTAYGLPDRRALDPVGDTISALIRDVENLKAKAGLADVTPDPANDGNAPRNGDDYADLWNSSGI